MWPLRLTVQAARGRAAAGRGGLRGFSTGFRAPPASGEGWGGAVARRASPGTDLVVVCFGKTCTRRRERSSGGRPAGIVRPLDRHPDAGSHLRAPPVFCTPAPGGRRRTDSVSGPRGFSSSPRAIPPLRIPAAASGRYQAPSPCDGDGGEYGRRGGGEGQRGNSPCGNGPGLSEIKAIRAAIRNQR